MADLQDRLYFMDYVVLSSIMKLEIHSQPTFDNVAEEYNHRVNEVQNLRFRAKEYSREQIRPSIERLRSCGLLIPKDPNKPTPIETTAEARRFVKRLQQFGDDFMLWPIEIPIRSGVIDWNQSTFAK